LGQTSFSQIYDHTLTLLSNYNLDSMQSKVDSCVSDANNLESKCMYYTSLGSNLYATLTFDYSVISKCVVELMAGNSNSMYQAVIYSGTGGGFTIIPIAAGSGITVTTATGKVYISRTGGSAYIRINPICGNVPTVTSSSTAPT
jgi:hypothetical protein